MSGSDEPTTEALRIEQAEREQDELRQAEQAPTGAGERAAQRRAEKAGYLKDKLDEQAASDEQPE